MATGKVRPPGKSSMKQDLSGEERFCMQEHKKFKQENIESGFIAPSMNNNISVQWYYRAFIIRAVYVTKCKSAIVACWKFNGDAVGS